LQFLHDYCITPWFTSQFTVTKIIHQVPGACFLCWDIKHMYCYEPQCTS
jgi:hypothetical protein